MSILLVWLHGEAVVVAGPEYDGHIHPHEGFLSAFGIFHPNAKQRHALSSVLSSHSDYYDGVQNQSFLCKLNNRSC
jgi:hypothetical protein